MRSFQLLAVAAIVATVIGPARAADVTIKFSDEEQQAFAALLDQATRNGGLAVTQNTIYFYNKMHLAIDAEKQAEAAVAAGAQAKKEDHPKPAANTPADKAKK